MRGSEPGRGAFVDRNKSGRGAEVSGSEPGRGADVRGSEPGRGAEVSGSEPGRGAEVSESELGRGAEASGSDPGRGAEVCTWERAGADCCTEKRMSGRWCSTWCSVGLCGREQGGWGRRYTGVSQGVALRCLGVSEEMCGSDPGQAQTDTGVSRGTAAPFFSP